MNGQHSAHSPHSKDWQVFGDKRIPHPLPPSRRVNTPVRRRASDKDKIVEALSILSQKGDNQNAALIELATQTRETKTLLADVMAQRAEFAAHVKNLKASIDTTRQALDPEVLGQHVAQNNNAFMGDLAQKFAKIVQIGLDAAQSNQNAAQDTKAAASDLSGKLKIIDSQSSYLAAIAERLEDRDARSKWDWATLGCAMLIAALLAGGGAFYYAQATIREQDFNRSVQLISQDDDARWCGIANGQIIQDRNGTSYCAITMPEYQVPEPAE